MVLDKNEVANVHRGAASGCRNDTTGNATERANLPLGVVAVTFVRETVERRFRVLRNLGKGQLFFFSYGCQTRPHTRTYVGVVQTRTTETRTWTLILLVLFAAVAEER